MEQGQTEPNSPEEPRVPVESFNTAAINACSFQQWYPRFREYTFRSLILQLPDDVRAYLLEDGLFLPPNTELVLQQRREIDEIDEDNILQDTEEEDEEISKFKSFPEFESIISSAIDELGGEVIPKLNWSSPKDATWIHPRTSLKCRNAQEILLLLKASDAIAHDLEQTYSLCADDGQQEQPILVLREAFDLLPAMEFRSFVSNDRIVGISQRDVTIHYPFLQDKKTLIEIAIVDFFNKEIKEGFRDIIPSSKMPSYVFDCYVTPKKHRVRLIDFGLWRAHTLPLLFSWDELDRIHDNEYGLLRLEAILVSAQVDHSTGVMPSLRTPIPNDLVEPNLSLEEILERVKIQQESEKSAKH